MDGMEDDACCTADIFENAIAEEDKEYQDGEEYHWPVYMGVLKKCDMGYLQALSKSPSPARPFFSWFCLSMYHAMCRCGIAGCAGWHTA